VATLPGSRSMRVSVPRHLRLLAETPLELRKEWKRDPDKRQETTRLLEHLALGLQGKRVLELGPGTGASLQVFRDWGAECRFVERHPAYGAACRIRGFRGIRADFIREPERLPDGFDVLYLRGSITCANFAEPDSFSSWLEHIGSLASTLLICPWVPREPEPWFASALMARGCRPLQVQGHNEPIYPTTWVRVPSLQPA
jgi:hypothetical protein